MSDVIKYAKDRVYFYAGIVRIREVGSTGYTQLEFGGIKIARNAESAYLATVKSVKKQYPRGDLLFKKFYRVE